MSGPFASRVAVADRLRPFAASDELGNLLPDAEAIKVSLYAGHDRPSKRIGFGKAFASIASLREAVTAADPSALEVLTRLLPAIGGSAAEAAFNLLELAPWPELEDAALEAIASLQTERAFRCLLSKATPRALSLLSGRPFAGSLPIVEELLAASPTLQLGAFTHATRRALASMSAAEKKAHRERREAAAGRLNPAERIRDQSLLMSLGHAGPSTLRPLVFRTLRQHPQADVRRTAANVLLQWGDPEALDVLRGPRSPRGAR